MKYWNKDKEVRKRCWIRVSVSTYKNFPEMKRWCQQNSSDGKFYFYFGSKSWWFQYAGDALIFKLQFYGH